jgi:Bax protein|tara:strand:+ start:432 stop:926 length:495 start_codon:yes stop_codon:yes gene_type:complete
MKHICATLLVLCSTPEIENKFINEIKTCAVQYNSILPESDRIPISLVIAQAVHESAYGTSRFAEEANNFFGIKAVNGDEYILSLNNGKKLKKYYTWCESVEDYMELLLTGKHYKSFQKELINQWVVDTIEVNKLVDTLDLYAEDVYYKDKIKKLVISIERKLYE